MGIWNLLLKKTIITITFTKANFTQRYFLNKMSYRYNISNEKIKISQKIQTYKISVIQVG